MVQTITFSSFCDAFHAHDRYDSFSYKALRVIFDYLEQYEEDTAEKIELDVVAICCDYTVGKWENIAKEYNIELDPEEDSVDQACTVLEYLQDNTIFLGEADDGTFVYQQF